MNPSVNPESPANEADLLDQRREVREADVEPEEPPDTDVEADPADLQEQSLPVPSAAEEEDRRDG